MFRTPVIGICRVCGIDGKLTYEHVPSRSAFNAEPATIYTYDQWLALDATGRGRYELKQRGSGYYAFCETCNSTRGGTWYVPEYEAWVHAGAEIILALKAEPPPNVVANITLHDVRPALFAKQMVMMLLALNAPEFGESFPELREYVRERDAVGLPDRFRFFLSLLNVDVARYGGLYSTLNFETRKAFAVTDLLYPPFAYTLTIDEQGPKPRPGEITWFTTLVPDDRRKITLTLPYNVTVLPPEQLPAALAS